MSDLITFGEAMVVFIAENEGSFEDVKHFSKGLAGAELNVGIGISRLGHKAHYITRLGEDKLGDYIANAIEKENISSTISREKNNSTGHYFKSKVAEGDPEVKFFRKNSAATLLSSEDIDKADFTNAKILHVTGIAPAISKSALEATYYAINKARKHNMLVTFDPNIRVKLWENEEKMRTVLNDIASKCDIILPGIKEANILTKKDTKREMADFYLNNGATAVIIKDGEKGAYLKTASERKEIAGFNIPSNEEKEISGFKVANIVDTVGAGDGFATGVLSGILNGQSLEQAIIKGNAIGAIVIASKYDNEALPTEAELDKFIKTHQINKENGITSQEKSTKSTRTMREQFKQLIQREQLQTKKQAQKLQVTPR